MVIEVVNTLTWEEADVIRAWTKADRVVDLRYSKRRLFGRTINSLNWASKLHFYRTQVVSLTPEMTPARTLLEVFGRPVQSKAWTKPPLMQIWVDSPKMAAKCERLLKGWQIIDGGWLLSKDKARVPTRRPAPAPVL